MCLDCNLILTVDPKKHSFYSSYPFKTILPIALKLNKK